MSNKNNQSPTSKLWVRLMCGFLGLLMVGGVVFMLAQLILG